MIREEYNRLLLLTPPLRGLGIAHIPRGHTDTSRPTNPSDGESICVKSLSRNTPCFIEAWVVFFLLYISQPSEICARSRHKADDAIPSVGDLHGYIRNYNMIQQTLLLGSRSSRGGTCITNHLLYSPRTSYGSVLRFCREPWGSRMQCS